MVETLAVNTSRLGCEIPGTGEVVRAEALFVSKLQSSESPAPDQVHRAVATTMRCLGIGGCAAQMAREFGDHPDTAAAPITWALATIRTRRPAADDDADPATPSSRKLTAGSGVGYERLVTSADHGGGLATTGREPESEEFPPERFANQPALHGRLDKIRDLGGCLRSVRRLEPEEDGTAQGGIGQ
jgi:hypothetical protein